MPWDLAEDFMLVDLVLYGSQESIYGLDNEEFWTQVHEEFEERLPKSCQGKDSLKWRWTRELYPRLREFSSLRWCIETHFGGNKWLLSPSQVNREALQLWAERHRPARLFPHLTVWKHVHDMPEWHLLLQDDDQEDDIMGPEPDPVKSSPDASSASTDTNNSSSSNPHTTGSIDNVDSASTANGTTNANDGKTATTNEQQQVSGPTVDDAPAAVDHL